MGFLKNRLKIFLIAVLFFFSCMEQPIIIKYIDRNNFGMVNEREYFIDSEIGDSLRLIWTNETTGSYSNFSPLIFDDYILVADLSGNISSFDRLTGVKNGSVSFNGEIAVTPVFTSYKIFFPVNVLRENYSVLYSYDINHGKVLSEYEYKGVSDNEIIYSDGMLFILTTDGVLHKFNDVGYFIDKLETGISARCDPAADESNIYWGNQKGEIISVDMKNLKINYKKNIARSFEAGLTIHKGNGFIGDIEGNIYRINLIDGKIIWKYSTGAAIKNQVVTDGIDVFSGNLAGNFTSVNFETGIKKYMIETGGLINATPLVFRDYIILPDLNKTFHIIEKMSGKIEKSITFNYRMKMTPVFYKGILYLGADRGEIYALKSERYIP